VVHVHSPKATSWSGATYNYWNNVDQNSIDTMVDQGIMLLTGTNALPAAWKAILPNHKVGQ
jgi:hypothetical protein